MDSLVIIGAGGFGREVCAWAEHESAATSRFAVKGFLDDSCDALEGFDVGYPVLGKVGDYRPEPGDVFVIAIGTSSVRMRLAEQLQSKGWKFATLVHPTSIIGPRCTLGEGSIVCPYCVVTADVTIGKHVILNVHTTVGHDARIDDGCTISPTCDITGHVHLSEGVLMGTHAAVTPGITVGKYSVIGAGSVAIRTVPDLATVVGVPAKKIFGYEPIVDENWQPPED